MIRSFLKGEQTDWGLNLECLAGAYRSTPYESTGLTPNLLMLGREIKILMEILLGADFKSERSPGQFVQKRKTREKAHEVTRKHLAADSKRRKDFDDNKSSLVSYEKFDKVWYLNEVKREGVSPKLQPLFIGSYLIIRKHNDLTYQIQIEFAKKQKGL